MANPFQVRASVNAWLGSVLPVNPGLTGDQVAYQAIQEARANEWRVHWDSERLGEVDQGWSRLVQIDRSRGDGDENALEQELAQALILLGLTWPGKGRVVQVFDYPDNPGDLVGSAIIRRFRGDGWEMLPDPEDRPGQLRATITLQVEYDASV